ncbi:TrkA C-terminal domain-containing protein [Alkalihalobacillus sp. LMS39]|uniref:cation:proton antiporter regulatory subunit n=1 Tax=Alkalihalobacillus sp. LMS39 TaxID=2924032 RepID=UPI001FB440B0|nr:TrkA C-terminal domain-containing protein [Alkalihalobacillus sp. LMS39]UOE93093.1 potassium transporter TrkA [Alkalihalobacillus sp. LMS39]
MKMNMSELPGVGKKISFINAENQLMAVVFHHTGKRELYFFEDAADDEASFTYRLTSDDTKQLATQLLGATFSPLEHETIEKIKMARKQIVVEWIELAKQSSIVGSHISILKEKMPVGAKVIGIFRDEDFLVDDEFDYLLEANDTIMVVGKKEAVAQFEQLCEGKSN